MSDDARTALVVYYSFSNQTARVVDSVVETLAARGYEVTTARIEFTDPRYAERFTAVPMRRPVRQIVGMLPAQLRRATGQISVPAEAKRGDYDLVVVGSPTWWLTTNMPVRSYLESPQAKAALAGRAFGAFSVSRRYWRGNMKSVRAVGEAAGGRWLGETHFLAAGGQVRSMLSWLAYMKNGSARSRVLGMTMPPPNLQPDFAGQAKEFANRLADQELAGE